MRIKSNFSEIKEYCPGKVTLIMDTNDDLWHFYNILYKGDLIQIKTTRKLGDKESGKSGKRHQIFVTIKIESIDYDSEGNIIRVNGKNVCENEFINIGQYQSADLKKGIQFSIIKRSWDPFCIEKLEIASNPTLTSDLAVCLMEEGMSNLFLVSSHITVLKSRVEHSIPKKRTGASKHDKELEKFFSYVLDSIIKNINFEVVKCLVIGSPGFVKDQFSTFISEKLNGNIKDYEIIQKNFKKFTFAHTSSCFKGSLNELLINPEVLKQINNTKASEDILLMNKFDKCLSTDYEKIIFGMKQVDIAIENKAIDFLLVTDDYLRKIGPNKRKELNKKFEAIIQNGGIVKTLSSMHPTGQRLNNLGGMTGVVKFVITQIEEMQEDPFEELTAIDEESKDDKINDEEINELLENNNLNYISEEEDEEKEKEKEKEEYGGVSISHGDKSLKPTKSELKERDLVRKKSNHRKRSMNSDDEL